MHSQLGLSELFSQPDRTLIVYHFMFGMKQTAACPMCSMWADGWNAITDHLDRRIDFVVAASAPIDEWTELATSRGWDNLSLVSAKPSSFKLDIGGEDADGNQWPSSAYGRSTTMVALYSGTAAAPGSTPSTGVASTCSRRSGTSSISRPRAAATHA